MKLFVVSDTHQRLEDLHAAVLLAGPMDVFIHAGDETADAEWMMSYLRVPVVGVAGNWDKISAKFPISRVVELPFANVFLTHGHRYGVKASRRPLAEDASRKGCGLAIYGHSHVPSVEVIDGIVCVNPGSLSQPRGDLPGTFVVMELTQVNAGFTGQVSYRTQKGDIVREVEISSP